MHVLVAGGCRQEQQKEIQEHKEEMQDEMGGRGQEARTRPVRRQGLEVGAKLISTSSFLPMHLPLCPSMLSGEDGIEVVFDEPRAPPPAQLPSSHLALYGSQYERE